MSSSDTVCGVLLVEEAYSLLGEAIAPYVREGIIGKYIYCSSAFQNGYFLDMTFKPEQCAGAIKDTMVISAPLRFI